MAPISAKFHEIVVALEAEDHRLAADARAVFNHYEGIKPLLSDFRSAVAINVKEVVAEEMKVVSEIKADVQQIRKDVVAEVAQLLSNAPTTPTTGS